MSISSEQWNVVFALTVVLATGCIDTAPESNVPENNSDIEDMQTADMSVDMTRPTDMGDLADVGLEDMESDARVETVDGTSEARRLNGLFNFEGSIADAIGNLEFYSVAVQYASEGAIPQGSLAVSFDGNFLAETNQSFPDLTNRLVVGSWVRDQTPENNSTWVSQGVQDMSNGWSVGRIEQQLGCRLGDGPNLVFTGVEVANFNDWNHVVCQFDLSNNAVTVTALVNGIESDPIQLQYRGTSEIFRLGSWFDDSGFAGEIDELFVSTDPGLGTENLRKIWACGVNGLGCRCLADSPAEYATCGEADCSTLSACAESDN